MENSLLGALEGLDGAADKVLAAGGEDLQVDIVGDLAGGLDEAPCEVEVGLGGGGEGDLDLLVAELAELSEVAEFLLAVLGELAVKDIFLTIGSAKLWLPSRRSVASQRGGLSKVLVGHCLLGKFKGLKGLYLVEGSLSLEKCE
ncbi:hypothetical protein KEM55_000138 [Ascosphaera atra]|nr:hypothetical protein KEM55_000138 [Ascosphaera atra]